MKYKISFKYVLKFWNKLGKMISVDENLTKMVNQNDNVDHRQGGRENKITFFRRK